MRRPAPRIVEERAQDRQARAARGRPWTMTLEVWRKRLSQHSPPDARRAAGLRGCPRARTSPPTTAYLPLRLLLPVCELPDVPPFLFDLAISKLLSDKRSDDAAVGTVHGRVHALFHRGPL